MIFTIQINFNKLNYKIFENLILAFQDQVWYNIFNTFASHQFLIN